MFIRLVESNERLFIPATRKEAAGRKGWPRKASLARLAHFEEETADFRRIVASKNFLQDAQLLTELAGLQNRITSLFNDCDEVEKSRLKGRSIEFVFKYLTHRQQVMRQWLRSGGAGRASGV